MDSAPHFSKLFSQPAIKIIVGKEKQTFYVPENALLLYGSWFKKCLNNSDFIERKSRTIVLSEQSPTAFSIFLFWIFHGILPQTTSSQAVVDTSCLMTDYIETYLLAQYLMIDDLKDAVMDRLCRLAIHNHAVVSKSEAVMIWNQGEEELKRFMIEAVVYGRTDEDFSSFTDVRELNLELNREVVERKTHLFAVTRIEMWCHFGVKGKKGEDLFVKCSDEVDT